MTVRAAAYRCLMMIVALLACDPVTAQEAATEATVTPLRDTVWHQPAPRVSTESQWLPQSLIASVGTIVEMDPNSVRIEDAAGNTVSVATDRVVWLAPDWRSEQARQGMGDFADGRYAESIPNLLAAVQQRPAVWQQQWLTAHLAIAAAEAGKFPAALELVQQLERSRAPTPMIALLPIQWTSRPANPAAIAAARQAISADGPAVRLVAASWLLSSPGDRQVAERMLDALVENAATPTWIAKTAEAVRWRRTPVPRIVQSSGRWLEEIERMPVILQGGPLLAAADRLQAAGQGEEARELYLTVALLAKQPPTLAAQAREALASAGQ